jgi:hypothetical protein
MRTVKDFVRQMFKEKKSPEHIRAVAHCSKWAQQMDEVDKWIARGKIIMGGKKGKGLKIKIRTAT